MRPAYYAHDAHGCGRRDDEVQLSVEDNVLSNLVGGHWVRFSGMRSSLFPTMRLGRVAGGASTACSSSEHGVMKEDSAEALRRYLAHFHKDARPDAPLLVQGDYTRTSGGPLVAKAKSAAFRVNAAKAGLLRLEG